jgi:hypothetical protein
MDSKAKQFFTKPSWELILASSLVIAVTLFSVKYVYHYVGWVERTQQHIAWMKSDAPRQCKDVQSICSTEAALAKPSLAKASNNSFDLYGDLLDTPEYATCKNRFNFESLKCWAGEEVTFSEYLGWENTFIIEIQRFLATIFFQAFAFFSIRRFYDLNHLGWQRITGAATVLVGLGFFYTILGSRNSHQDAQDLLKISIVALILVFATAALPSLIRDAYNWFREGFSQNSTQAVNADETETALPHNSLNFSWRSISPVLKYCALVLMIGLLGMLRPESSGRALAKALVEALGIGAVWYVYKKFQKK